MRNIGLDKKVMNRVQTFNANHHPLVSSRRAAFNPHF
jgi:hypothetical protein